MKNLILLFSVVLTLCGCSDDDKPKENSIDFQTIAKGELYGNGEEGISQSNMVIKDVDTWTNLMAKMNSKNNVTFTETDIDFNQYQVIAVFDIIRPHTGFSVIINDIIENQENLVVSSEEKNVKSGYTVLNQPYHIVKLNKTSKQIIFK